MKNDETAILIVFLFAIIIFRGFIFHCWEDTFTIIVYFTYGLYSIKIYNYINKFKL